MSQISICTLHKKTKDLIIPVLDSLTKLVWQICGQTKKKGLSKLDKPSYIKLLQTSYALPSEPNTSIRSSTDAWIALTPSAKNLRGSKSFFLSYSASFAS